MQSHVQKGEGVYMKQDTLESTRFSPREGFEDLVFTSKTNNPINAANIKDSINYIVDRINRENPEQLDQNATAPTAR